MVVINNITTCTCTLNVRYNILYKVSLENFSSIVTCISLIIFCMVPLSFVTIKVLDVVRANYDSLTLKLQDSLDQYERYSEKPRENAFFTNLVSQNLFIIKFRIFKSIYCCVIFLIELFNKMILLHYIIIDCWIPNLEIIYFFFQLIFICWL